MSESKDRDLFFGAMGLTHSLSGYEVGFSSQIAKLVSPGNQTRTQSLTSTETPRLDDYISKSIANRSRLTTDISVLARAGVGVVPLNSRTSQSELFYAFTKPLGSTTDTAGIAQAAQEAMMRVLQAMSKVYQDVLDKCQEVIQAIELDDPEARDISLERLRDVLEPFNSVLETVFAGLLEANNTQPVAISFLLSHVLPSLDKAGLDVKIAIIRSVLTNAKASTRFAAMQALDDLGTSKAKQIMSDLYPRESNWLIRSLIASSLQAG